MARRKLNRRQQWRVEKIQQERVQRAQRRLDRAMEDSPLGAEQPGLVISNFGGSVEIEADGGAVYRCLVRQNLDTLVVGDRVAWQATQDGGVVVAIMPRRSVLARPDLQGQVRPLAANLDRIVVVAAPQPVYSTELIDQYLVAAETTGITPMLLLNKADLMDRQHRDAVADDLRRYRDIGYSVDYASTVEHHGLDALLRDLAGHTSVFVGQSGVGKSSLVNALLPLQPETRQAAVGALSESSGLGRHTTSASRLYHLPSGGAIIDSPGVREFRLWNLDRTAIANGFVELRPLLGRCRFRNCRHEHEPGCALDEALQDGSISPQRLESFRRIAAKAEAHQLEN